MAHVAPQRSHFIALLEVFLANRALVDAPEAATVVLDFGGVVNYVLASAPLLGPLSVMGAQAVDDARTENDQNCDHAHHDEGLRQDEAHHHGEDE